MRRAVQVWQSSSHNPIAQTGHVLAMPSPPAVVTGASLRPHAGTRGGVDGRLAVGVALSQLCQLLVALHSARQPCAQRHQKTAQPRAARRKDSDHPALLHLIG